MSPRDTACHLANIRRQRKWRQRDCCLPLCIGRILLRTTFTHCLLMEIISSQFPPSMLEYFSSDTGEIANCGEIGSVNERNASCIGSECNDDPVNKYRLTPIDHIT